MEHLCESIMNLDQWFRRCLYLALVAILLSGVEQFVKFLQMALLGAFPLSFLKLEQVIPGEMSVKDTRISNLELWWPFWSAEHKILCNFGKEHYEELFCVIIFEFGLVVQEMPFKSFFISSSGGHFIQQSRTVCQQSRTVCAVFVSVMSNISVKLFLI